jgi:Leucine-rich repeat (LRR) protein
VPAMGAFGPPLSVKMLVLAVTLCGCGLMGGVRSLTMTEIGNLVNGPLLKQTGISLSYRNLTGSIPPEIGSLTNLSFLDLSNNKLSGPIPPEIGSLTKLHSLYLNNNNLSGPIPPELGSLTKVFFLWLTSNKLSGPIPSELGNLTALTFLLLNNNKLSGIPPELGNLTNLSLLYLDYNSLSGPIPPELGSLINLKMLSLSFNSLSGPIPSELGSLTNLIYDLDLSSNKLSGPIPPELGSLTSLENLYLANNNLSGPIPPELGSLTRLSSLDLSNNNISGPIPPELGSLNSLKYLYLNNNNISGPIPLELGTMTGLDTFNISFTATTCEELDLSRLGLLTTLGLPCSPPPSLKHANLTSLDLSVGTSSTKHIDLSSVPDSCKIVNLTGAYPHLENFRFWDGCEKGCILNLAGSGAKLSRSARKKVCLSRISIFIGGDIPYKLYDEVGRFNNTLKNQQGLFFLEDPNFVDSIDLGPEGAAYTGVGFSRVQAGNLCGNPEAKLVAAFVFGLFAVLLLLATITIIVVARWRRQIRGHPLENKRSNHR